MTPRILVVVFAAVALTGASTACSGTDGAASDATTTDLVTPVTTTTTTTPTTTTPTTTTTTPTTTTPTPTTTTSRLGHQSRETSRAIGDEDGIEAADGDDGPTVVPGTLDFRDYELVVPSAYDGSTPVPLVVMLHGYTASGAVQESYFQLTPLAEERTFLLVYPDGTFDPVGSRFWNATDACCNFADADVDDVGHLLGIIDRISADYEVDPHRVHLIGHSNGGFMAYRMACEHADVIASIVSLAGATYADSDVCSPSEPVGVLQVHGTLDPVIRYEGGELLGAALPGAFDTAAMWAASNGCDETTEETRAVLDLDEDIAGADTTVTAFVGCPDGGQVELWTIEGGGHVPALTDEFRTGVIDALLDRPKPAGRG